MQTKQNSQRNGNGAVRKARRQRSPKGKHANQALEEVILKVCQLAADGAQDELRCKYRMGECVKQVQDDEAKYTKHAVVKMAKKLTEHGRRGFGKTILYDCGSIARAWTYEEFTELVARRNAKQRFLGFNHLVLIAKVEQPEMREAFITKALDEDLTVPALKHLIAGEQRPAPTEAEPACDQAPALVDSKRSFRPMTGLVSRLEGVLEAARTVEQHPDKLRMLPATLATENLLLNAQKLLNQAQTAFGSLLLVLNQELERVRKEPSAPVESEENFPDVRNAGAAPSQEGA